MPSFCETHCQKPSGSWSTALAALLVFDASSSQSFVAAGAAAVALINGGVSPASVGLSATVELGFEEEEEDKDDVDVEPGAPTMGKLVSSESSALLLLLSESVPLLVNAILPLIMLSGTRTVTGVKLSAFTEAPASAER